MTTDLKQATLDFCNEVRQELSLPPLGSLVRGRPCTSSCCPVSNTVSKGTNLFVTTGTSLSVYKSRATHEDPVIDFRRLPLAVWCFTRAFDSREYPELVQ